MKKQIIVEVDEDLHRDFKTACSWLNKSMTQVLIADMEEFCNLSGIVRGAYERAEKTRVSKVQEQTDNTANRKRAGKR